MTNTEFMQIYIEANSKHLTEQDKKFLLEEAKVDDFFKTLDTAATTAN